MPQVLGKWVAQVLEKRSHDSTWAKRRCVLTDTMFALLREVRTHTVDYRGTSLIRNTW